MQRIVFISGYLCSGKGFYWRQHLSSHIRIGVSDIVKNIIGKSTRAELQDTAYLDIKIAQQICDIISQDDQARFVIDGIRQPSIFEYIEAFLSSLDIGYECVWLDVPIEECRRRFLAKNDGKENISFEKAFENDKSLGLLQLESQWKQNNCTIIKNY